MKESIQIYNPADPSIQYSILRLMLLPYTVLPQQHSRSALPPSSSLNSCGGGEEMVTMLTFQSRAKSQEYQSLSQSHGGEMRHRASSPSAPMIVRRSSTALSIRGSNYVTIRIVMPSNFGIRSWRWYEAIIETTAVGIYLYTTFVLTSLLFLNADKAMYYATSMAICLSVVRVLIALF